MELSALPNELLELVSRQLSSERDVNALARVNRRSYSLLNKSLYQLNHARETYWPGHVLYWATHHGRVETIIRAEALGVTLPAPRLISEAAIGGSMNVVEFLFERVRRDDGEPPDLSDPSALSLSLEEKHFDMFRFFLDQGADVNSGSGVWTPLHGAAMYCFYAEAQLLLEGGAELETHEEEDGFTPLHIACEYGSLDVAELFLEHSADIEARSFDRLTPLHVAAREGRLEIMAMLLEWGADIHALDYQGWTPILVAVESGQQEAANMLLQEGANQ